MPPPDGTLKALQVTVFPKAARHWRRLVCVGSAARQHDDECDGGDRRRPRRGAAGSPGRTPKLKYKGGEKTVVVPADLPIVTFKPDDRALLVPGAKVQITAQLHDGKPTALRALAGRNGVAPPM